MNRPLIYFFCICLSTLLACANDGPELKTVKTSKLDEFVRNPIQMGTPVDSSLAAQFSFDQTIHEFEEVQEGEVVTHVFKFTNVGQSPLLISEARSTCGCTVPEWPKDPIDVNESGEIKVRFKTAGKPGFQDKPISIYANTLPGKTVVRLRGNVKGEKK